MRNLLVAFLALIAFGTGGCSVFWLGLLVVDPMWRDMAQRETLTYSAIGLALALACLLLIHLLRGKEDQSSREPLPLKRKIAAVPIVIIALVSGAYWATFATLSFDSPNPEGLAGEGSGFSVAGLLISLLCVFLLMRILKRPDGSGQ